MDTLSDSPFKALKPGDKVVYHQDHSDTGADTISVGTVRSNDGIHIILEEIWGWTFRVSDGNPVGYDKDSVLCTYIVPTTPALIERVMKREGRVQRAHERRKYVYDIDWYRAYQHEIDSVYKIIKRYRSPDGTLGPEITL